MTGQILNERARIDLETGNFEANSKKVVALLNQIKAAANGANTGLNGAGNAGGAASSKFAALGKAMAALRTSANGLTSATNTLSQRMAGVSQHLQQATAASQHNTTALNGNTHAITALAGHIATLQASVDKLTHSTDANTAATQNAGSAAQGAAQGFSGLGGVLAGLSFAVLAKEAIGLTDAYRSLETRLTVSSRGIASSGGAMRDVSGIAKETRSGLEAIGSLYSKVAMAGSHFGATQTQVARVTETVAKGLGVMGASAQETESTILQLGQALASGRLQGDEFRSMTENAPALMEILAKATGKPRAALKALATEGKLTSDIIISAFGSNSAAIKQLDADFAKMPMTVAQSMTLFKNSIEESLGTSESMVGATKTLAGVIQGLANNMNIILPVIGLVSTAIGIGMVTSFVRARIAAGALGSSLLGAFGGPIGLAVTALTVGIASLAVQVSESNNSINALANSAGNAADKTQLTGVQALMAARGVASFGGQAGAAAGKLWDMATAARAAAIETAKLSLQKSVASFRSTQELTDRGFSRAQDRDNATLTESGASFGERVSAFGSSITRGVKKSFAPRQERVVAARGVAYDNMMADGKALQELQGRKMETFIPKVDAPVSSGGKKDGSKGGSKTDRVADFWKGLEREKELASMITPELEEHQKLFDLQDAMVEKLGKKFKGISDTDKQRVVDLLAQTRAAKLVVDITEKTRALTVDNAMTSQNLWRQAAGESEGVIAKAKALDEFESEAIRQKIDLNGEAYRNSMKAYGDQLDKANQLKTIEQGIAEVRASSVDLQNDAAMRGFDQRRTAINAAVDATGSSLTEKDRRSALRKVDMDQRELENKFYNGMGEQISSVADLFGKRMGLAVDKFGKLFSAITKAASGDFGGFGALGSVAKMLTTNRDGSMNKLGEGVTDSMNGVLTGIAGKLGIGNRKADKVAEAATDTAASNDEIVVLAKRLPDALASTLTAAMVGAGVGGAIGGTAGGIGGALGGAALQQFAGKALGAFAGPLGGIVGGIAGKLLGGLFKKTSKATAVITSVDGSVNASGSSSATRKAATGAAGDVQSGLKSLAEQLGGMANGAFNVSIGTYKDKWRVNQNGGVLGGKKGSSAVDFGKDGQAEAVSYAINLAIKQGAITGLSEFAQKALSSLGGEGAVALVTKFNETIADLDSMTDPLGSTVRAMNSSVDSLLTQMRNVGASSTDLSKIEEYRSKKLASILDENVSSLRDFQKSLNSSEYGVSQRDQLAATKTAFDAMKADIQAGKTIDQDKFTSVASDYNNQAAALYGSSGPLYQAIKGDVSAITTGLISNITTAITGKAADEVKIDPAAVAVAESTSVLANILTASQKEQAAQTAILKEIAAKFSGSELGGVMSRAINGQVQLY